LTLEDKKKHSYSHGVLLWIWDSRNALLNVMPL